MGKHFLQQLNHIITQIKKGDVRLQKAHHMGPKFDANAIILNPKYIRSTSNALLNFENPNQTNETQLKHAPKQTPIMKQQVSKTLSSIHLSKFRKASNQKPIAKPLIPKNLTTSKDTYYTSILNHKA